MTARRLVVDGMNVIGSRPDGWWRDRPAAMDGLVRDLGAVAQEWESVTVVFDGRPPGGAGPAGAGPAGTSVEILFARRPGRDAADDRIVELVGADEDPGSLLVVTSDRLLGDRVRAVGAGVVPVGWLRARMGDPARDGAAGFRSP